MTLFWSLAGALAMFALLIVAAPALRTRRTGSHALVWGLAAGVASLALAVGLYLHISNWDWKPADAEWQKTVDELTALRLATDRAPEDAQAWLRLGGTYLLLDQATLAQRAFERANTLSGGSNAEVLSGLAESLLLGSGGTSAVAVKRAADLLDQALRIEPRNGKALFYSAMLAMRDGKLPLARERFVAMRDSGVPADIVSALDKQIASIDAQLKPTPVDSATAIHLTISVGEALASRVPLPAALFVFVRGAAGGPPLAVRRLSTQLPAQVTLSAADSMLAGNAIKPGQKVQVVARVSLTGAPTAQSGDPFGEVETTAGARGDLRIVIDKLTP